MKILFVSRKLGYIDPMSIALLSAVAKQMGHECEYRQLGDEMPQADVVAYSAFSSDMDEMQALNDTLDIPSIIGGPHATFAVEDTLTRGFDAVVIGEGELTFAEYLSGKNIDDIEGLATQNNPSPKLRPLIDDLDTIPMPDRDLILSSTPLGGLSKKTFFTSRGCPFSCTYCLNPALRKMYKGLGPFVRRFSPERVIAEIMDVRHKYKLDFVKFDDDCFALRRDDWLDEFTQSYVKQVRLPYNCLLRLDHASDELLERLAWSGCHSISTSIDSASERVRKDILNRNMSNETMIDAVQRIEGHGIKTYVNFILDLPGSSVDDDFGSIEMARKAGCSYTAYTFMTPFPGTEMMDKCIEMGIIGADYRPAPTMNEPTISTVEDDLRIRKNIFDLGDLAAGAKDWRSVLEVILTSENLPEFGEARADKLKYVYENVIYKCSDGVEL